MDFKKLIQVADVFGTETKKLAELKEGDLADRLSRELGWEETDAEEIEKSVEDTGNDPDELADVIPNAQTDIIQPASDPDEGEPTDTQDAPETPTTDTAPQTGDSPEQPEAPEPEDAPAVDTDAPEEPNTQPDAPEPESGPAIDTTTPEDPDANDPRGDQTNPPQTDAELDADSADNASTPGPDDGTRAGQEPNAAPQTDAELDADSADNATTTGQDDAQAAQGDALAGRLDTTTPSLLDAYNNGGRQAMDSVRDLQTGLSRLGFDPNGIDGKYGRGTYGAVQEFQRQNGLQVDGEAGPATMAKLQELLNARSAPQTGGEEGATQSGDAGDGTRGGDAPQTDAENDADSADSGTGSVDPVGTGSVDDPANTSGSPTPTDVQDRTRGQDAAEPEDPDANDPRGDQTNPPAAEPQVSDEDMSRAEELLNKLSQESGAPDAEQDGRERGVQTASTDFSMRDMLKLVESLTEALTQDEQAELERLIKKLQGSNDPRAKALVQRYSTTTTTSTKTTTKSTGVNKSKDVEKVAAQMRAGTHPIVKKAEQMLLNGAPIYGSTGSGALNNYYMDAIQDLAYKLSGSAGAAYQAARADLNNGFYGYFNKKYMGGSDSNYTIQNTNRFFQQIQSEHGKSRTDTQGRTDSQGRIRTDFSWDNNMLDKQPLKENKMSDLDECGQMPMPQDEGNPVTMSVTLNASGEQHVQDLIRMMQLAGAKDAAPVADMHHGPVDKHDDMVSMMQMMGPKEKDGKLDLDVDNDHQPDLDTEGVEEEWDNAPDEEYKDHKHMTKDLSGGLNREKKAYAKAQDGDNAMAVESIKDQLIQALEGKYANDAQRKAVHAAKDKKKK